MFVLVIAAIVIVLGSWLGVSNATSGVAGICFSCFLLILARMVQAEKQHKELLARLQVPASPAPPPRRTEPEVAITGENIAQVARKYGVSTRG